MKISARQLFVALLFIGLFAMSLRPVADPDFWWHLRTGQLITESGVIPREDPFSLTKSGQPWIAHEWLSELLLYTFFNIGGLGLLVIIFSAIITSAFLLVYLRSPARPFAAGFVLIVSAIACAPTWGVRPQMISVLFVSIFLFILERYKQNNQWKILIFLPIITAVWVNLHAAYILGLAVIGLHILSEVIEVVSRLLHKESPRYHQAFMMTAILVACLTTSLINPNSYQILVYPFQTLTSPSMMQFIQEWFSPDFHRLEWLPLALLFLALPGAALIGRKKVESHQLLLVLFFGFFALRSMRNVPFFSLAVIPVLASQFSGLNIDSKTKQIKTSLSGWLNPMLLLFTILATVFRFITVFQDQPRVESESYPQAAVEWIARQRPEGNIYNTYGWGGYLIWKLYPEYKVFIDGRADVYGDQFIYDYLATYNGQPGWEEVFTGADIRLVLIEPQTGLANALQQAPGWQRAFEDQFSILFIKDD